MRPVPRSGENPRTWKAERMESGTVATALEREHREIDGGIETFRNGELDPRERSQALQRAIDALRRHIYLEEEFLFPPMQQDLAIPTMVMLREHGEIWRKLDRIEARMGEEAGSEELKSACGELLALLEAHNLKEEPIFYGVADETLSQAENSELAGMIETSTMPSGWICARAEELLPPVPGQDE